MDQPRGQFLAETEDLIEQIFVDLDGLRENKETGLQRKLVDRIFRRLHRIKGSAATFGLDGLSEIAHEFESLLSSRRAGTVVAGTGLQERQNSKDGTVALVLDIARWLSPTDMDERGFYGSEISSFLIRVIWVYPG